MTYLAFWMKMGKLSLLAVQLSSPLACESQRRDFLQDPTVDHAVCVRGDERLEAFLKTYDCDVMEGRDNFANYICAKAP